MHGPSKLFITVVCCYIFNSDILAAVKKAGNYKSIVLPSSQQFYCFSEHSRFFDLLVMVGYWFLSLSNISFILFHSLYISRIIFIFYLFLMNQLS
jgi:hypothetical protein